MIPSLQHRAAVAALRLLRVQRDGAPDRMPGKLAARDAKEDDGAPNAASVRGLTVEQGIRHGWPVWTLAPLRAVERSGRVVFALHGGAYIQGIQNDHYRAYADVVRRSGATVIIPIYPLAPHGTAGTVVPVVADQLVELIAEHGSEAVSVLGDSAGAGLALAAVQELVRRDAPVPARLVLVSPWLDVTLSDRSSRTIDDPMLNADGLVEAGRLWAGDLDPADPMVSPLFGPLNGLPDTAVYSGTLDRLVADTYRLRERAKRAGLEMDFTIEKGLLHVWAGITILPEYKRAAPQLLRALVGSSAIPR